MRTKIVQNNRQLNVNRYRLLERTKKQDGCNNDKLLLLQSLVRATGYKNSADSTS